MALRFTKEDWEWMAVQRRVAFQKIADRLGEKHPITKAMGDRAWGRHNCDYGPDGGLQDAIRAASALDGAFDILNRWARDNDAKAQRVMLEIYPLSFQRCNAKWNRTPTTAASATSRRGTQT
jgi:hypothetical protein